MSGTHPDHRDADALRLAAGLDPGVLATAADPMEVVAACQHAVAIEVHTDLASGSAPRADRAQVREGRKLCSADGVHDQACRGVFVPVTTTTGGSWGDQRPPR
jgi:hypothetical protein